MTSRLTFLLVISCALISAGSCASIADNYITETPRIASSDELISSIINQCFSDSSIMTCLKGKVLTYLDSVLGLQSEQGRAFDEKNVDKVIFERVARLLAANEFQVQLPEPIFQSTIVTYRADRGLDFVVPQNDAEEARGDLLKKKLLLPVLLLLKLKMKALMPIFVAIIGIKAMKALVLSKLAITLVLGFIISQLVKKSGLGMPMSMMPMSMMPPAEPMPYGPPTTAAPSSSYDPSGWEPQSGGPYARVWEPSSSLSSSHNSAYSSYYPGSSSSASTSGSSSSYGSSGTSSSSSSPSSSSSAHAY